MHAESKLRKENHELKREIITLRKRFEALRKKHYRKSKKIDELNKAFQEIKEKYQQITTKLKEHDCTKNGRVEVMGNDDDTPTKQADNFRKENLTHIDASKKQIVKRKLLEHNDLTKSLKEEYKKSVGTEKNTLKKIVTSEIVKKI
ncbi:unnamed protein product [Parnassius apollo]|uniref:(apollo) hypothetical protein n=1 Tax=Parnassius apollo TaxID=110799 RepID=A0A8S3WJH9_PARAO|nr:unnamed protein product [Parnassius apollo]